MSALARIARTDSEQREIKLDLQLGTWALYLTVRYAVSYASPWHRGRGIDPDITVLSVTYEDGGGRRELTMLPGLHEAICLEIEAEELQD